MGGIRLVPSATAGPWMRIWREEYARLSRQQLAIALSYRANRRVTADVIREWEGGQVPASTEELDALSEMMGRYWIPQRTVEQFRHIISDVGIDSEDPSDYLFARPDELAYASNVDELAGILVWQVAIRLPDLAVLARVLEDIVLHGKGGPRSRRLARKQTVALCLVRAALAQCQEWEGQMGPMAYTAKVAASFTRAMFGAHGLVDPASPLSLECKAAYGDVLANPSGLGPARRLVAIRDQAMAQNAPLLAARAHFWALDACPALPVAEAEALRAASPVMAQVAREISPDGRLIEPFVHLLGDALRGGRTSDAEAHLMQLSHLADDPGWQRAAWLRWWGDLAYVNGDTDEAERCFERAQAHAAVAGSWAEEREARARLAVLRSR